MLLLNDPKVQFHQTFTFQGAMTNAAEAKRRLNRTLGTLHRTFEMISVYVTEDRGRNELHYQAVFLFYLGDAQPCSPSHLENEFRNAAFNAWSRANNGTVTRAANRMTVQKKDFETLRYLTKEVRLVPRNRETLKTNWSGARTKQMIARHSKPMTKTELNREVRQVFNRLFAVRVFKQMKTERNGLWDMPLLRALKTSVTSHGETWDEWTRRMGYRMRPIPDKQFLIFLQSKQKTKPWLKEDLQRRIPELL